MNTRPLSPSHALLLSLSLLGACAPAPGNGADAAPGTDAASGADASPGADAAPMGNGCAELCAFLARAACPNYPAELRPDACMNTCATRLLIPVCDRSWRNMLACVSTATPAQYACNTAGTDVMIPSCAGAYESAWSCLRSANSPTCYGAQCSSDSDCPSRCNSVSTHCYELSAPNSCVGMPCASDSDCPSRCNTTAGTCYTL